MRGTSIERIWRDQALSENILYFAYGSNLFLEQMQRRIVGEPKVIGADFLEKHRLGFTIFSKTWNGGVADIVPEAGLKVWGAIYELTKSSWRKSTIIRGIKRIGIQRRTFAVGCM